MNLHFCKENRVEGGTWRNLNAILSGCNKAFIKKSDIMQFKVELVFRTSRTTSILNLQCQEALNVTEIKA